MKFANLGGNLTQVFCFFFPNKISKEEKNIIKNVDLMKFCPVTMEEDLLTAVTGKEMPGAIVAPLPSLSNR